MEKMRVTKKLKTRDMSYELIRVIAMIFIVFDHNLTFYFNTDASKYLEPFFVVGVTLFFMLSGKFAFKLNVEDKSLYKKFYWKKIIGLIIPMLIYMAIKNWHVMVYNQHLEVTPISYLRHFGISLVNGFNYMEYWFLYTLIALLISVPFTARMMQNLKRQDKKAFIIVSAVLSTLSVVVPAALGVDFAINYYFIGYVFFFYAGYITEDLFDSKKLKQGIYFTGLLSFIMTILMIQLGLNSGYKTYSPFYLFFTFAMFVGIHELGKKISKRFEKIISFAGKHSLSVYMLHMIFLYTIHDLNFFPMGILGFFGCSFSVIITSLIVGALIDNAIVKALQKLTIKVFKLENTLK